MDELIRDELNLEYLASFDDADRLLGAAQLEEKGNGYFDDGGFSNRTIDTESIHAKKDELISAYENTRHDVVKKWILFFLDKAFVADEKLLTLVSSSISPNCGHLHMALAFISGKTKRFQHDKEKIKSLYKHEDPEVRWRCSLVLRSLSLTYNEDIEVIRALMLDSHPTTRTYAVLALKNLGRISSDDRTVLEKVIDIDDYAARAYAQELIATQGKNSV